MGGCSVRRGLVGDVRVPPAWSGRARRRVTAHPESVASSLDGGEQVDVVGVSCRCYLHQQGGQGIPKTSPNRPPAQTQKSLPCHDSPPKITYQRHILSRPSPPLLPGVRPARCWSQLVGGGFFRKVSGLHQQQGLAASRIKDSGRREGWQGGEQRGRGRESKGPANLIEWGLLHSPFISPPTLPP